MLQNSLYSMCKKTHVAFFSLMILCNYTFSTYECGLVYVLVAQYEKRKITTRVFLLLKYSKFWCILLKHFVEHKPLISEECQIFQPSPLPAQSTFFPNMCMYYLHKSNFMWFGSIPAKIMLLGLGVGFTILLSNCCSKCFLIDKF